MKPRAYLYEGSGVILAVRHPEDANAGSSREVSDGADLTQRKSTMRGLHRSVSDRLIKSFVSWLQTWLDRRRVRAKQARLTNGAELAYLDEDRAGGWLERRNVLLRAIAMAKPRGTTTSRPKRTDWDEKLD